MARSANQKLKLLLLRQYLERNSDEAHPVTTAQLLEYLASEGISAERKSIYSDLEALQSFGLDLIRVRDGNLTCWYIGHVNAYSAVPVIEWLKRFAPYLRHFHLHNNDGSFDAHAPLDEGSIPMKEFLQKALALCPAATFTLELQEDTARGARWLLDNGFITKETNA